jgi:hypothetical protein
LRHSLKKVIQARRALLHLLHVEAARPAQGSAWTGPSGKSAASA